MKNTLFIILLIILSSCNNSSKTKNTEIININIDKNKNQLDYSKFISEIELIPLNTSDRSLIGNVNKLICHNDKYYILDRLMGTVFVFNDNGSLLSRFSKIGSGPDEFQVLYDFDIDARGNLHILVNHKIMVYNSNDRLINEFSMDNIKYFVQSFKYINDGVYALSLDYLNENEVNHHIVVLDFHHGKQNSHGEIHYRQPLFYGMHTNHNNQILFDPPLGQYEILMYDKGGFITKYKMQFGDFNITHHDVENIIGKENGVVIPKLILNTDNKVSKVLNVFEFKDGMFFNFLINNVIWNGIYDKEDGITSVSSTKHRLAKKGPRIHFETYDVDNNCLIGVINPYRLRKLNQSYLLSNDQIDFLNSIDRNNNPIIVRYQLK